MLLSSSLTAQALAVSTNRDGSAWALLQSHHSKAGPASSLTIGRGPSRVKFVRDGDRAFDVQMSADGERWLINRDEGAFRDGPTDESEKGFTSTIYGAGQPQLLTGRAQLDAAGRRVLRYTQDCRNSVAALLDLETGDEVSIPPPPGVAHCPLEPAAHALSSTRAALFVERPGQTLWLWKDGAHQRIETGVEIESAFLSDDAQHVAYSGRKTSGFTTQRIVAVLHLATGRTTLLYEASGQRSTVADMQLSTDGRTAVFAVLATHQRAQLFCWNPGKPARLMTLLPDSYAPVKLTGDGRKVMIALDPKRPLFLDLSPGT